MCAILARLDPALVTLAQDGPAAFRDRYELIHRHRAATPNALWQADHTLLDILIRDQNGKPVRPWLTTVIDEAIAAGTGTVKLLDGNAQTIQTMKTWAATANSGPNVAAYTITGSSLGIWAARAAT